MEKILVIVGGGIGGVSLACFASQTPTFSKIILLERGDGVAKDVVGGGLGVWCNSLACLAQLPGVVQQLEAQGSYMPNPGYRTQTGLHLARPSKDFATKFPVLCLQRLHLISTLYEFARKQPCVEIRFQSHVMDFKENGNVVHVSLANGESLQCEVMVIADGINSKLRNAMLQQANLPAVHAIDLEYTYFRGVAHVTDQEWHKTSFEQWGGRKGDRFAIVPLKYPQLFWFAALQTGKRDSALATALATEEDKQRLVERFKHWRCDAVKAGELIACTEHIIRTDITKVPNVTGFPWSSASGRVVLLGDAAHATSPNIAQGAGLCMEDAMVLANALKLPSTPVKYAVQHVYEKLRKPRAETVQFVADAVAIVACLPWPLNLVRNLVAWIGTNLVWGVETKLFEHAVNWSLGGSLLGEAKWMPPSLTKVAERKQSLLGRIIDLDLLPEHVQRFKSNPNGGKGEGTVTVQRGSNPITYLLGLVMGLPPAMTQARFVAQVTCLSPNEQQWTRTFAVGTRQQVQYSTTHRLWNNCQLSEGIGGVLDKHVRFLYDCKVVRKQLEFQSVGVLVLGCRLPVPQCLLPQSSWVERPTADGWEYDGQISLPVFGRVMRYFGKFAVPPPSHPGHRVLVAGGTGMIGEKVCEALADAGCEVVVLSRRPGSEHTKPRGCFAVVEWDGKTAAGIWTDFIDSNTVLLNLSGENPASSWLGWTSNQKRLIVSSRLDSIQAFAAGIQLCAARGVVPKRFLQASASGIYPSSFTTVWTETSDLTTPHERAMSRGSQFRFDCCQQIEHAAYEATRGTSVPVQLLRIGHVLSAKGGLLPSLELASLLRGARIGSGTQVVPWVHINDVANAVRFLATTELDIRGPVNINAPAATTNRDLLAQLARARARSLCWIPVPEFAIKLALRDIASVILDSTTISPSVLLEHGFAFEYADVNDALLACKTDY
ncbi:hypothetical protein BASA81_001992 [Batrachochytrium salamandrivorans]|nr:hypothetical protein BASA81_001992 [Batrachochytrium salamandrivorans]